MVHEEASPAGSQETSPIRETVWTNTFNIVKQGFGRLNRFRYRTPPGQAAPIKEWMKQLISWNEVLIEKLTMIESKWKLMDKFLWDPPQTILSLYQEIGHYDDPNVVKLEIGEVLTGSGFGYSESRGGFYLDPFKVKWNDGNKEDIYYFGLPNIKTLIDRWDDISTQAENNLVQESRADASVRRYLTLLRDKVKEIITQVNTIESTHHQNLLHIDTKHRELANYRGDYIELTRAYSEYIRFKHIYKVIKPFIIEGEKPVYFNPDDNPYVNELKKINEEIPLINEDQLTQDAEELEKRKNMLDRYIKNLQAQASERRFEEYIDYLIQTALRKSEFYTKLKDQLPTDELNDFLLQFRELTRQTVIIRSNLKPEYIGALKGQALNQIKSELLKLKLKEDDATNFIDFLISRTQPFTRIRGWGDFQDRKSKVFAAIKKLLDELGGIDIDDEILHPELHDMVEEVFEYSVIDREIRERILLERMSKLKNKLNIEGDEIIELTKEFIQKQLPEFINAIRAQYEEIERIKTSLEKITQELNNTEQELNDKREQLGHLEDLKRRKAELERDITQFSPKHPNFYQKEDEAGYGLDENGYPLEIDHDGTVLLDKWWYEIGKNAWQLYLISRKPGGKRIIEKIREITEGEESIKTVEKVRVILKDGDNRRAATRVRNLLSSESNKGIIKKIRESLENPDHENAADPHTSRIEEVRKVVEYEGRRVGIRKVDKRFTTDQAYLDLLEMSVYIYNEVDAVRDDLRDGRYHPYSKSTTDYIFHAEGGLDIDVNKLTIPSEILKEPIRLEFNPFNMHSDYGYVKARPSYFNRGVPKEEIQVTRKYIYKDVVVDKRKSGETAPKLVLRYNKELYKNPDKWPERKPTNLNPAFDRRAINRKVPFIHWGRMMYYEEPDGINKWSENPYPHISTRGLAKYIIYWIAVRTNNLAEAIEAAESEKGYDIGIRRPIVGGPFVKNPFKDIISMGGH
ncbi:hypothetical protein HY637_04120 [Candidatus Woesearchaeota archaeon]|nr:hypothetical protein [Candidatus Woesearchaeota archaeon]